MTWRGPQLRNKFKGPGLMKALTRLLVLALTPLFWSVSSVGAQNLRETLEGQTIYIRIGESFDQRLYFHSDGRIFVFNAEHKGGLIIPKGRTSASESGTYISSKYDIAFSGASLTLVKDSTATFTSPPFKTRTTYRLSVSGSNCKASPMIFWSRLHGDKPYRAQGCRIAKGPPK